MSEAETDRALELQQRWRALVKLFPSWSLPVDWFLSPSSYRMLGVDLIAGQIHDPRVRRASGQLQGLPPAALDSLSHMAALNADRATNIFRAVAVCYVTLPIALSALMSDAAPDQMRAYLDQNLERIAPFIFAAVVTPIFYFFSMWRAKQIAWAIDLHRAGGVTALTPGKKR